MSSKLSIGVPLIDQQHEDLLQTFEKLCSADGSGLSEALSHLTLQIIEHFRDEEEFMSGLTLPEPMLAEHIQAHGEILEELAKIQSNEMLGCRLSAEKIVEKVTGYVIQHLVEFDLLLKPYLDVPA